MGATKERRAEIRSERHEKWLKEYVNKNKYLRESKYYKNQYWSMAAFDSWAAQGKAGSCSCGCGYYNGTLRNRGSQTIKGGRSAFLDEVSVNLCYNCISKIEDIINYKFRRR